MKWTSLTEDQYIRLCECRSIKADIVPIARAYMIERGYDPLEAFITTLEHLDANSQYYDPTKEEADEMLDQLRRFRNENNL